MTGGRTHIPLHDHDRCLSCGGCTAHCPATPFATLREEPDSLRGVLYRTRIYGEAPLPAPPCQMACPLGQDVPGYVSALARGDQAHAAAIVRETNALPGVCGRLCVATCMRACPYSHPDSLMHNFVRAGLKRSALFRQMALKMDDFFYGRVPEPAEFPDWLKSAAG